MKTGWHGISRKAAVAIALAAAFLIEGSSHAQRDMTGPRLPEDALADVASPNVTYGHTDELPLPKTIFFGAGLDDIIADHQAWADLGIQAFFVDYVAREWSTDIWGRDGQPWTIGRSDATLQKAKQASAICDAMGAETFLKVAFDHTYDWFDDVAWQRIDNNFQQFAIFSREAGFTGIALDIEYIGEQYDFEWEGYDYDGYTRKDLVATIRQRMTRVMSLMYDEFPDMVFLTFPEQWFGVGAHVHVAWIEEAARRNAPGGVHYCTESTYRSPNIDHMFAYAWAHNMVLQRLLSEPGRRYWMDKCTIAAGVWPFSSDDVRLYGPGMAYKEMQQALAASLMTSPRYNWLYGSYTQKQLIGRELEKYTGEEDIHAHLRLIASKQIVTTPKYVALAKELRAKKLRDYSEDLGIHLIPRIIAPNDRPRVELLPEAPYGEPEQQALWDVMMAYFNGEELNLREQFGTQTHWMLIGPFPNEGVTFAGHNTVYPPEQSIDLAAEYDGAEGKVRWVEHRQEGAKLSVNLKEVFEPSEYVCAYALCYVTCPRQVDAHVRVGTNDSGKVWVGGKLVYDYPYEGNAILDRGIIPATLPEGTTPILLKICNGALNWGFIFRITDDKGRPVEGLRLSLRPPE